MLQDLGFLASQCCFFLQPNFWSNPPFLPAQARDPRFASLHWTRLCLSFRDQVFQLFKGEYRNFTKISMRCNWFYWVRIGNKWQYPFGKDWFQPKIILFEISKLQYLNKSGRIRIHVFDSFRIRIPIAGHPCWYCWRRHLEVCGRWNNRQALY